MPSQCPDGAFSTLEEDSVNLCKPETAIGVAAVTFNEPQYLPEVNEDVPVFNLVPAPGEPARLGIDGDRVPIYLDTSILTGKNYAVEVTVHDKSVAALVLKSVVSIWGEPGDTRHNRSRGWACLSGGAFARKAHELGECEPPAELPTEPFLRMPTSCTTEMQTTLSGESWPVGQSRTDLPLQTEGHGTQNLGLLRVAENFRLRTFDLGGTRPEGRQHSEWSERAVETPQTALKEPGKLSEADVRENTVALPAELQANAGAANGLQTCSAAQMGFEGLGKGLSESAQTEQQRRILRRSAGVSGSCEDRHRQHQVAAADRTHAHETGEPEEIVGSVYMASQNTDPFISPLAIYIVAQAPVSKVLVKLAGSVNIGANGQLITTFKNTPQAPFERLELHLFDGPRASQATPAFCGTYTRRSVVHAVGRSRGAGTTLHPSFAITHGVGGGACPGEHLSFSPEYKDGLSNKQAGGVHALHDHVQAPRRPAGARKNRITTPPGLAAVLASVPLCANPQSIPLQTTAPPCSEANEIGTTKSLSGLGGDPVNLEGKLYLTEGYGGAPFGLLAVTKAKAGPVQPRVRRTCARRSS